MAIKRLQDIRASSDPSWADGPLSKHQVNYDLESFIWVTYYSILVYTTRLYKRKAGSSDEVEIGEGESGVEKSGDEEPDEEEGAEIEGGLGDDEEQSKDDEEPKEEAELGDDVDPSEQLAQKRQGDRKKLIDYLVGVFNSSKLEDVLKAKWAFLGGAREMFKFIEDESLRAVAVGAWELLFDQNNPRLEPDLIDHEKLCKVFKDAGA